MRAIRGMSALVAMSAPTTTAPLRLGSPRLWSYNRLIFESPHPRMRRERTSNGC